MSKVHLFATRHKHLEVCVK